ncbi:MAG TPA: STAS domain-containing protein [Nocardioidaceae bacterium]|nr:STAS domain-containing protein [Nocardioidaceae bacterium]
MTWLTSAGAPSDDRYTRDALCVGHCSVADGTDLMVAVGALDLSTTPVMRELIIDRTAPGHVLLLDLRAVTLFGSSALTMLIDTQPKVTAAGGRLVLIADGRVELRALRALSVPSAFDVADSVEAALHRLGV